MRVATVETDDRKPELTQLAPEPGRRGTAFEPDTAEPGRALRQTLSNDLRISRDLALEENLAGFVDAADRGLLQRYVETGIGRRRVRHGVPPGRIDGTVR